MLKMQADPFIPSLSERELFEHLQTSSRGLSEDEVLLRRKRFGRNLLKEEKISKWKIFFSQFNSLLIYVLIAASLISLSIGEWRDFTLIICIIALNGIIGFLQELKAEASIASLKKLTESRNKVIREGHLQLIPSSELVPGDYLIFHEGELVTADVRLIESAGLMVDESTLTGESVPVVKDHTLSISSKALPYEWTNTLLAGTSIVRGTGRGVVFHTGKESYLASIAEKATEQSPPTPLTKSIATFIKRYIILLLSLFLALALLGLFQGRSFLELSYLLIAALVSAVPEGLPIVITLTMVIGALALSKQRTLVRYLPAVETLGSATVIASDKTGTITEGKLIVQNVFSHDENKLQQIAALCNDSHQGTGDPLDVALADWVEKYEEIRSCCPRKWAYSFDTKLMFMATVNEIDGKEELLIKGAYESLREKAEEGEEIHRLEAAFHSFLKEGLRVLALGTATWENQDPSTWKVRIIGLIGFLDPPKEEVKEAVQIAKMAGVRTLMITGDHPMTARAIAQEVGIWDESNRLLTGKEIEHFSDQQLLQELSSATVLARILPEHKYRIVKLLQQEKEIVAVTGDGINDIPALKTADIGIAMGNGAEAAKSAAKMVITDNNLKVIVDAIKNARVIADNLRKVIYYLISTSLQEVFLLALSLLFFFPIPLSAIQILWINLVTDGTQDKTFPLAKEEGDVMKRKPKKPERQFFDSQQIFRILYFGIGTGLLCFFLYVFLLRHYPFKVVSTIIFTSSAAAQWANGIQSQKESEPFCKNLKSSFSINPWIFVGSGAGVLLQCAAIYIAPSLFHSTRLGAEHWIYPLLVFIAVFAFVELRKWGEQLYRQRKKNSHPT